MKQAVHADAMGFLSPYREPPVIEGRLALQVVCTTSAPSYPKYPGGKVSLDRIREGHEKFVSVLETQPLVRIVRGREDLDAAGSVKVVCGLRCPPEDGDPRRAARQIRRQGNRMTNLSGFDGDHPYGAGFARPDIGLTENGREFVRACADCGMIGDVAHMSHRCIMDTLELIARERLSMPLMASHVGCFSVYPHGQNLPDEIIRAIFEMGGFLGIIGLTPLLSEKDDTEAPFFQHLAYALEMARKVGKGWVGFGSDAVYRDRTIDEARQQMRALLDRFPNRRKAFDDIDARIPGFPSRWITSGTRIPELIDQGMKQRGFDAEVIHGVLGNNLLHFLRAALPDAGD